MKTKLLVLFFTIIAAVPAFSGSKKPVAPITIIDDDFTVTSVNGHPTLTQTNAPSTWTTTGTGDACIGVGGGGIPELSGRMRLQVACSDPTPGGTAILYSLRTASLGDGSLVFETLLGFTGNGQIAWGLVSGTDRDNAIEFIKVSSSQVACRTVFEGTATETVVDLGQSSTENSIYQIVASKKAVLFFLNGTLVAAHKKNITTASLNPYFLVSGTEFGTFLVFTYLKFTQAADQLNFDSK